MVASGVTVMTAPGWSWTAASTDSPMWLVQRQTVAE
jgi:hypothetical protein